MARGTLNGRSRRGGRLMAGACATLVALASVLVVTTGASAATDTLVSVKPANFPTVLASSSSRTLYVLSAEKTGTLHCKASCLTTWLPLLVHKSVTHVTVASTVKGKIAFVTRSSTMKQVTDNGFPLYTYSGDSAAAQSHGEALVADGGTWYMALASAKTGAATEVKPLLQSASASPYSSVLAASSGYSYYLLSTEVGATLHCTGACLSTWLPLLVTSSTSTVAVGAGVKGKIGFVKRTSTTDQVTFNSYPVYVYTGDTGPGQSNGENISADGGTWFLLHAGATTAATTSVAPSSGSGGGGWSRRAS
jgi:predicted lipoprotein with Yx(FWY)xxD motif